jgi:hypothetical protein
VYDSVCFIKEVERLYSMGRKEKMNGSNDDGMAHFVKKIYKGGQDGTNRLTREPFCFLVCANDDW